MAQIKYLDFTGLTQYDKKIKEKVTQEKTSAVQEAKNYSDSLASNYDPAGSSATVKQELQGLLESKANKSTTLSGYGITDAYTKGQTDSKIAQEIAKAPHLKRQIVTELPAVGEADENTIYMVGTGAGSQTSAYEEYMLVNGAFEKIGSTQVDLTNYATKTYAEQKANDALAQAKTYSNGLAKNYATSAQGAKADTALQQADITTGTTNGTIKVKGNAVSVFGLKSAAYAEANSFDPAGTAQSKVTALQTGQVQTNTNDITNIKTRLEKVEGATGNTFVAITEAEINGLFS